ncbi:MAG: sulfite exporter TauE/SafE family protein [bacterium]
MEYVLICLTALVASGLTFFSGFGLGTILLPAFALFFPVEMAVAMTAIVHFTNNLFKVVLIGRHVEKTVALRFGMPAILASFIGAWTLLWLHGMQPLLTYQAWGIEHQIMPVKFVIAFLILLFGFFEILPKFAAISIDRRYLPLGGVISGFFGGLSGHQGALRSAFLIKAGLSKEAFIATGVVIACFVDVSRIAVYSSHFTLDVLKDHLLFLIAATLSAFVGATIGNKLVKKITLGGIQIVVSVMLIVIAVGLGLGII